MNPPSQLPADMPFVVDGEQVIVRANLTWQALCNGLLARDLRPLVVPEMLTATLAETLVLDETGDSSHLHGPIAASLHHVLLRDPEGSVRAYTANDWQQQPLSLRTTESSRVVQLGLPVLPRPATLSLRACGWTSVQEFVRDVVISAALYRHDFIRARLFFGSQKCAVRGFIGGFSDDVDIGFLRPATSSPHQCIDLRIERTRLGWSGGPWLALAFDLPDGLRAWPLFCMRLEELGFTDELALGGSSIAVLPKRTTASGQRGFRFRVILRPGLRDSEVARPGSRLRQAAEFAIAQGAAVLRSGTAADQACADLIALPSVAA